MVALTDQEMHYLGMNLVGKELEKRGFEFIAINSTLGKQPQFVCIDQNNNRFFVLVKVYKLPTLFKTHDPQFMAKFKEHAKEHNSKILFAGIGLSNPDGEELPIYKNKEYLIEFEGIQVID